MKYSFGCAPGRPVAVGWTVRDSWDSHGAGRGRGYLVGEKLEVGGLDGGFGMGGATVGSLV